MSGIARSGMPSSCVAFLTRQNSLVISAVVLGLWLVSYLLVLWSTRRPVPRADRATSEMRPESPALVSMLINNWEPGPDLAEATLLDLASRGVVTVRAPASGDGRATVTKPARYPGGLKEYEQMILDRMGTARDPQWLSKLAVPVVAEAREAGLWHYRLNRQTLGWLGGGALAAAAIVTFTAYKATGSGATYVIGALAALTMAGLILAAQRGQHTEAGRAAAAHWLGVRASLRAAPDLPELPTRALSEGDRWPAYGAALGVTRALSKELGIEDGDPQRPWSPQGGWHRVGVVYPRGRDHFGRSTVDVFRHAGMRFGAGAVLLAIVTWVPIADTTVMHVLVNFGTIAGGYLVLRGLYLAVRNLIDKLFPKEITGVVVARSPWRRTRFPNPVWTVPSVDYLAVDDGRDDETVAWAIPSDAASPVPGEKVKLKVHPWTRLVI